MLLQTHYLTEQVAIHMACVFSETPSEILVPNSVHLWMCLIKTSKLHAMLPSQILQSQQKQHYFTVSSCSAQLTLPVDAVLCSPASTVLPLPVLTHKLCAVFVWPQAPSLSAFLWTLLAQPGDFLACSLVQNIFPSDQLAPYQQLA